MLMYKLLLLFVIFLFVSFELYKRYDKFTVPESIHLVATSQKFSNPPILAHASQF